jgi:hypothetical protein
VPYHIISLERKEIKDEKFLPDKKIRIVDKNKTNFEKLNKKFDFKIKQQNKVYNFVTNKPISVKAGLSAYETFFKPKAPFLLNSNGQAINNDRINKKINIRRPKSNKDIKAISKEQYDKSLLNIVKKNLDKFKSNLALSRPVFKSLDFDREVNLTENNNILNNFNSLNTASSSNHTNTGLFMTASKKNIHQKQIINDNTKLTPNYSKFILNKIKKDCSLNYQSANATKINLAKSIGEYEELKTESNLNNKPKAINEDTVQLLDEMASYNTETQAILNTFGLDVDKNIDYATLYNYYKHNLKVQTDTIEKLTNNVAYKFRDIISKNLDEKAAKNYLNAYYSIDNNNP